MMTGRIIHKILCCNFLFLRRTNSIIFCLFTKQIVLRIVILIHDVCLFLCSIIHIIRNSHRAVRPGRDRILKTIDVRHAADIIVMVTHSSLDRITVLIFSLNTCCRIKILHEYICHRISNFITALRNYISVISYCDRIFYTAAGIQADTVFLLRLCAAFDTGEHLIHRKPCLDQGIDLIIFFVCTVKFRSNLVVPFIGIGIDTRIALVIHIGQKSNLELQLRRKIFRNYYSGSTHSSFQIINYVKVVRKISVRNA